MRVSILASFIIALPVGFAHPGEDHSHEQALRARYFEDNSANLAHCEEYLKTQGVTQRAVQRRMLAAEHMRRKRGLDAFPQNGDLNEQYESNQDLAAHFATTSSCALAPEEMVGPYYVAGEYIRRDLVESQKGIPLTIDVQFINSATCQPVSGAYIDSWQANSTGVYGGVVARENGSGLKDPNNKYNTWLRGVQKTDKDGVVQFNTLFPGHYEGRTIHIHVMAHLNAKPLPNGTLIDNTAAYVGQMYFDQNLIYAVEQKSPYNTNKQKLTPNSGDFILQQDISQGGNPFMTHKMVGNKLEDGLIAWLNYGINVTARNRVQPVGTYKPKPTKL